MGNRRIDIKTAFLTFVIFLFLVKGHASELSQKVPNSDSRELILIKNKWKALKIPPGKTIKVFLKNTNETLRGKYKIVSDSTVEIDGRTVNINHIAKINGLALTTLFSPILTGGGLISLGFGGAISYLGAFYFYAGHSVLMLAGGVALIGIGTVGIIAGAIIWRKARPYKLGGKWELSIQKNIDV